MFLKKHLTLLKFGTYMKHFFSNYKGEVTGILSGATVGWIYWYFVGCASGTCAISSKPMNVTLYGAFMGALLGGMFKKDKSKKNAKTKHNYETD